MEMKEQSIVKATPPLSLKDIHRMYPIPILSHMVYGMSSQELMKERVALLIDTTHPLSINASREIFTIVTMTWCLIILVDMKMDTIDKEDFCSMVIRLLKTDSMLHIIWNTLKNLFAKIM
jgi:hypothetical protein